MIEKRTNSNSSFPPRTTLWALDLTYSSPSLRYGDVHHIVDDNFFSTQTVVDRVNFLSMTMQKAMNASAGRIAFWPFYNNAKDDELVSVFFGLSVSNELFDWRV